MNANNAVEALRAEYRDLRNRMGCVITPKTFDQYAKEYASKTSSGKAITPAMWVAAAKLVVADADWIIDSLEAQDC